MNRIGGSVGLALLAIVLAAARSSSFSYCCQPALNDPLWQSRHADHGMISLPRSLHR